MSIADLLLPEYDQEMGITRRILERVPDGKADWKPHPKSFPLAHLAQLVARLPGWVAMVTDGTEFDIAPPGRPSGGPAYTTEKTATLLAEFDKNVKAGREAIARTSDEQFEVMWHFKRGGQTLIAQPRYAILRSMALNHIVHHRAQLGLYLRMLDCKVPPMYGPTADKDEGM